MIGKDIFPKYIKVFKKSPSKDTLGSAPFDSDGLPTREQSFIKDGVLEKYILSVYSARRLNMTPTGNGSGVRNLF